VGQEQAALLAISQNDQLVRQAGPVMLPLSPESGRTGLRIAAAGAAGLIVSTIGVLLVHWWKSPRDETKIEKEKTEAVSGVK
jgi:uncharacterized protein involved in exopolysaccharide biosynthesis